MIHVNGIGDYKPAAEHVNGYFVQIMEYIILVHFDKEGKDTVDYHEVNAEDADFLDDISEYFPPGYDQMRMGRTFLDLYATVCADDYYNLNIVEDYVLFQLIGHNLINKQKNILPVKLKEEIVQNLSEQYQMGKDALHHYLFLIQDVKSYKEICFSDWDMLLLNEYSFDLLKSSENELMIEYLGTSLDLQHNGPKWEDYFKTL